jgi:hypothetical protein
MTKKRTPTLIRQQRERDLLPKLYEELSAIGEEVEFSAEKMAEKYGLTRNIMLDIAKEWEAAGILTRRIDMRQDGAGGIGGRRSWWKLVLPLDEAIPMFEKYQETNNSIHTVAGQAKYIKPSAVSLKDRLWEAISTQGEFSTTQDLLQAVLKTGPSIDMHNLKHCLYSLQREGKVSFKLTPTKDRVPYDIRTTKSGMREIAKPNGDATNFRKLPATALAGPVERIPAFVQERIPEPVVERMRDFANEQATARDAQSDLELYPKVMQILKRKEWLKQAAELAEAAGEDEDALSLLSKLEKPLSPIELEAVALYEALKACRE